MKCRVWSILNMLGQRTQKLKFTKPPLILIFLKLEKKREKCKKNGKTKKQISKIQKTQKQNKRGKKGKKKGKTKRGKNGEKNGLVHLHFLLLFFCFFDLLFVCFFFAFILFFSRQKAKKKQNKSKTKAKKKQIEKAKEKQQKCKWTSPFFSHLFTLFDVPLLSHLFCFLFFSVLKFCFLIFHVFSFFFAFFSSLKNIRTKGRGENNQKQDRTQHAFFKKLLWCGQLCSARNRRKIFTETSSALMASGATIYHSMLCQLRLHSSSRYFC